MGKETKIVAIVINKDPVVGANPPDPPVIQVIPSPIKLNSTVSHKLRFRAHNNRDEDIDNVRVLFDDPDEADKNVHPFEGGPFETGHIDAGESERTDARKTKAHGATSVPYDYTIIVERDGKPTIRYDPTVIISGGGVTPGEADEDKKDKDKDKDRDGKKDDDDDKGE